MYIRTHSNSELITAKMGRVQIYKKNDAPTISLNSKGAKIGIMVMAIKNAINKLTNPDLSRAK